MQSASTSSVVGKVLLAVEQTVHAKMPGLSTSTRLADDLTLGSLGRLRLAMCLEQIFDVELRDDVVERFGDVGDVVGYFSDRYFRDVEFSELAAAA